MGCRIMHYIIVSVCSIFSVGNRKYPSLSFVWKRAVTVAFAQNLQESGVIVVTARGWETSGERSKERFKRPNEMLSFLLLTLLMSVGSPSGSTEWALVPIIVVTTRKARERKSETKMLREEDFREVSLLFSLLSSSFLLLLFSFCVEAEKAEKRGKQSHLILAFVVDFCYWSLWSVSDKFKSLLPVVSDWNYG